MLRPDRPGQPAAYTGKTRPLDRFDPAGAGVPGPLARLERAHPRLSGALAQLAHALLVLAAGAGALLVGAIAIVDLELLFRREPGPLPPLLGWGVLIGTLACVLRLRSRGWRYLLRFLAGEVALFAGLFLLYGLIDWLRG